MNTAEVCANCEEPLLGQPVFFDGGAYCCTGCIVGGPCICTYQTSNAPAATTGAPSIDQADQPSPAPSYSAPIAAAPADRAPVEVRASTDAPTAGRDPIPFPSRENSPRAIVLRLGGFRDQRDLLEFALTLEDVGVLAEVSLTRAEPADAWFAVRAASTQQVVAALQEVRGWLISAHASESYVEGRVEGDPVEVAPAEDAPVEVARVEVARVETEPVLPHRPRFRVFSPRRETTPVGAGFTFARPAAMQPMVAPADVAPARPIYTAPPMPVLPMPAHPAPVPQPEVRSVEPNRPVLPAAQTALEMPVAALIATAPVHPAPAFASITAEPMTPMHLVEAVHQPDMIAVDGRPGGAVPPVAHLTLVVYPFHSFVALNEFQGAIRVIRGVTDTRVRRFYRGTLHLAVDYEDVIPLAERLQDLRGFRWQVVSESHQEIELLLEDTDTLMAVEGDG